MNTKNNNKYDEKCLFFRFIHDKLKVRRKSKGCDSIHDDIFTVNRNREKEFRRKNRAQAIDALTTSLSAFYAKMIVVLGLAFPITDVLTSSNTPHQFYKGFHLYLYIGSISFVAFMYVDHLILRRKLAASASDGEKWNKTQKKEKKIDRCRTLNYPRDCDPRFCLHFSRKKQKECGRIGKITIG